MSRKHRPRKLPVLVLALAAVLWCGPVQAAPLWESAQPLATLSRWVESLEAFLLAPFERHSAPSEGDKAGALDPDGAPRTNQDGDPEGDRAGALDPDGAP